MSGVRAEMWLDLTPPTYFKWNQWYTKKNVELKKYHMPEVDKTMNDIKNSLQPDTRKGKVVSSGALTQKSLFKVDFLMRQCLM